MVVGLKEQTQHSNKLRGVRHHFLQRTWEKNRNFLVEKLGLSKYYIFF
jgi:hypothetical protein